MNRCDAHWSKSNKRWVRLIDAVHFDKLDFQGAGTRTGGAWAFSGDWIKEDSDRPINIPSNRVFLMHTRYSAEKKHFYAMGIVRPDGSATMMNHTKVPDWNRILAPSVAAAIVVCNTEKTFSIASYRELEQSKARDMWAMLSNTEIIDADLESVEAAANKRDDASPLVALSDDQVRNLAIMALDASAAWEKTIKPLIHKTRKHGTPKEVAIVNAIDYELNKLMRGAAIYARKIADDFEEKQLEKIAADMLALGDLFGI
jgi:hypothetical protein